MFAGHGLNPPPSLYVCVRLTARSSIWLQAKNYRKPLLQRYVVRILLMVPIYSIASWTSMISLTAAAFLDPVRDIYEAFTIYTFFQLLINYLGGERSLIIMTHGRAPVQHLWPMNRVLPPVDISDPYTFLSIKRGILQYAWLKPLLALSAVIMKATGTYQEGYIAASSGYFWSGIIYNISVTLSLYSLGLFWVCMHHDLTPFRPMPKFLCIKLVIFASYWQGFFLSILVWLGAIPDDVPEYTPDNIAAAIQDALICIEMPLFAVAHWYAFSWHDFADNSISSARLPVGRAFRDAFGVRDLIEDSKDTFRGDNYGYRIFDSGDKVMAHEDSKSRLARLREGMRYERGGKGKYWIPKPGETSATTPLLGSNGGAAASSSAGPANHSAETVHGTFDEPMLDPEEDRMYEAARELEYGDWNVRTLIQPAHTCTQTNPLQYPVITANEPLGERYLSSAGNFGVRAPRYPSPQLRSSVAPRKPPSPSSQLAVESRPSKSKKKKKATTNTAAPSAAASAPPPAAAAAASPVHSPVESPAPAAEASTVPDTAAAPTPWAEDNDDDDEEGPGFTAPSYQVPSNDEFRNVWDEPTR